MNLTKNVRFALNAMNAVKQNFSPLQAECGEKILALSAKCVKKIFSPLQAECGEIKFQRYHRNAVKQKILPLTAECGENKFFTATSRMR